MFYIGIATDEERRAKPKVSMEYPLIERWGMSQADTLAYCRSLGYDWGGLYDHFDRVSCWCCPLKNLKELRVLFWQFPEYWQKLEELDQTSPYPFRKDYTLAELRAKFTQEERS